MSRTFREVRNSMACLGQAWWSEDIQHRGWEEGGERGVCVVVGRGTTVGAGKTMTGSKQGKYPSLGCLVEDGLGSKRVRKKEDPTFKPG